MAAEADEVVVQVKTCSAIRYLREHQREILPCFCQHCHFVSAAIGTGAGVEARIVGGNGSCSHTYAPAAMNLPPQDLRHIKEARS